MPQTLPTWLVILIAFLLLGAFALWRGGRIKTLLGDIEAGGNAAEPSPVQPTGPSITNTNTATATAEPHVHVHAEIPSEKLQEMAKYISNHVNQIRTAEPEVTASTIFGFSEVPQELQNLLRARHAVNHGLRSIGIGGWAGASLATSDVYLQIANDQHFIPDELAKDIDVFLRVSDMFLSGGSNGSNSPEEMVILGAHIATELKRY
jgi:hypothetical protein